MVKGGMMESFHWARVGLLDSDLLLTSPFSLLLKLYFKGRLTEDFFFNVSLKNSQFQKKKKINLFQCLGAVSSYGF